MKNRNAKLSYKRVSDKYLVFGLIILVFACFATCKNPVIERWWPAPAEAAPEQPGPDPNPGGRGDNFGVVIFDTDGGTPQPKAIKIAWNGTIGRLRPISKNQDAFLGWIDENTGLAEDDTQRRWDVETRQVKPEDDVDGDGFITLTAKWEPYNSSTVYIVNFETYSDISVSNLPEIPSIIPPQYIASGGCVIQPVVPKPPADASGFPLGFAGWYTFTDFLYRWDFSKPVAQDETLYAKWENNTCTVHFEANGGTRPDGVTQLTHTQTISMDYGYVQDPGPLIKEGYTFSGWYDNPGFSGSPWDFENDMVPGSAGEHFYLYARWKQSVYLVNFIITPSPADVPETQSIIHGGKVIQPASPPQLGDGRGFGGWYFVDGDKHVNGWQEQYLWDFNNTVTSSMTLYARWLAQTRTVVFKVNGGNDMSRTNFTIPVGGKILNPGSPARTGYNFKGWFFDPACTSGNSIDFTKFIVTTPDTVIGMDSLYLYAGWSVCTHYIAFNIVETGGATSKVASQYANYGERVQRPDITTANPGNYLNGWYTDKACTIPWNFDTGTITSNRELYARWEAADYIVRFHLGNHVSIPSFSALTALKEQNLHLNGKVVEPFMPVNTDPNGWSFYRWYSSKNPSTSPSVINSGSLSVNDRNSYLSENPWDFNQGITDDVTEPEGLGANRVLNLYARWVPPEDDMVWVPRGSFTMGDSSVAGTPASCHSYPTRRTTVDGFYISRYEVTQIDGTPLLQTNRGYQQVVGVNPSQFTANTVRPVERVSWYDAINYCIKLTSNHASRYGLTQVYKNFSSTRTSSVTSSITSISDASFDVDWTANGYRLPTEAEWEYAARGGNNSPGNFMYSGSNNADNVAWYNVTVQKQPSGTQSTQTVGRLAANALGIYDMSGNVSEWVWDWFGSYKDSYFSTAAAGTNPRGPDTGTERVRRGGGWSNAVGNVRSVVRNSETPSTANWVIGFRVVRGPSEIW